FSLQFFPEIRLPNPAAHSPFVQLRHAPARKVDHLANKMNRAQTGNQNQRGQINSDDEKDRTDWAESCWKQPAIFVRQAIANAPAAPLNPHRHLPPEKMADPRGLMEPGARDEKKNNPGDGGRHPKPRKKKFPRAKAEQNGGQQQQSKTADQLIENARRNRSK